jgi:hypothetical protein
MGKCKRFKSEKKNCSNWRWENFKKTTFANKHRETLKAFKKVQKEPLDKNDLLHIVKKTPYFLGVYSSDELASLSIHKYPVSLIVNLDISRLEGSHWIAISVSRRSVEVFDSLGFNPGLWGSYPLPIFKFLSCYSFSHNFHISPVLQPPYSLTCGLYCVYFIIYRQKFSFRHCISQFSSDLSENYLRLYRLLIKKVA